MFAQLDVSVSLAVTSFPWAWEAFWFVQDAQDALGRGGVVLLNEDVGDPAFENQSVCTFEEYVSDLQRAEMTCFGPVAEPSGYL